MTRSILRKWTKMFSILAMGFLFQNCSDLVGETEGGSGSGEGPALPPVSCSEGFVGVPGNSTYGTQDFCVMKYEAKQSNEDNTKAISVAQGTPWTGIRRSGTGENETDAMEACTNSGYQLLTNNHWQTIARNIESVKENWANNEIGNEGGLNRGHSDRVPDNPLAAGNDTNPCMGTGQEQTCDGAGRDQKRTHTLSNRSKDEVIWDIAGNVSEWMSDDNGTDYGSYRYISQLTGDVKIRFGPSGDYSDLSSSPWGNLGQLAAGTNGTVLRGGAWSSNANAGVFAAILTISPSGGQPTHGFRCFYTP